MNLIKKIFYPFTLLTLISIISVLLTIYSFYVAATNDHTASIYAAIAIPITLFIIFLYIIDRFLITKISYAKLMFGEVVIAILIFFTLNYQFSTNDVNFFTDKDYILVLFDSNENPLSKFHKKGLFGRELNVYNSNLIHLNSEMASQENLRINAPTEWNMSTGHYSFKNNHGNTIKFIYNTKNKLTPNFIKNPENYIDSLIRLETNK